MEPNPPPSSLHKDDAGDTKKKKLRERPREMLLILLANLLCIVVGMMIPILVFNMTPPEFSVQLEAINKGLDVPGSGGGTSMSSAFSLLLHHNNRRFTGRCYHNGEALVSYGGFTVATGRVPGFCVPGRGDREVRFLVAAQGGVLLPEHVLDRMALERRLGGTQLDVEVKLFRRDDNRPPWLWCGLRMDGAQPPSVIPCTVLGLQNWVS